MTTDGVQVTNIGVPLNDLHRYVYATSEVVNYWCTKCRRQWSYTLPRVSCCVFHSDGHCHYGETPADGFD